MTAPSVAYLTSASTESRGECGSFKGLKLLTNLSVPRRLNYGLDTDEAEQGNARNGVKKARLRRIITGGEVILTPESVHALQSLRASAPAYAIPTGILLPYVSYWGRGSSDSFDLNQNGNIKPLLAGGIPPGVDPWFLGSPSGLDPFSSLPHTEAEPIPKNCLLFHCKHSCPIPCMVRSLVLRVRTI